VPFKYDRSCTLYGPQKIDAEWPQATRIPACNADGTAGAPSADRLCPSEDSGCTLHSLDTCASCFPLPAPQSCLPPIDAFRVPSSSPPAPAPTLSLRNLHVVLRLAPQWMSLALDGAAGKPTKNLDRDRNGEDMLRVAPLPRSSNRPMFEVRVPPAHRHLTLIFMQI
jgi:hypothetical protein